jgi:vacuolar-type H+-ATPase subunit E/Vma4
MGLEEILKNIEIDTRTRTQQITDAASAELRKMEESSELEVAEFRKSADAKSENDAKQLMTRELSRANAEARALYQKAVNEYLDECIETIQQNTGSYIGSADYPKLLGKLADMAVEELGNDCTIMVQKNDIQKLKGLKGARVQESRDQFMGGLRAESADGTMYVDYSIEKIMDSLRESVAVKLLNLLES